MDEEIHGFREELMRQRTFAPGGGCGMNVRVVLMKSLDILAITDALIIQNYCFH